MQPPAYPRQRSYQVTTACQRRVLLYFLTEARIRQHASTQWQRSEAARQELEALKVQNEGALHNLHRCRNCRLCRSASELVGLYQADNCLALAGGLPR